MRGIVAPPERKTIMLNDKVYAILKWACLVFYPAAVTLTSCILVALGVAGTDVIITILVAVETFFGTLLGVSTVQYNKAQKKVEK